MVRRILAAMAAVVSMAVPAAAQSVPSASKDRTHLITDKRGNAYQWFLPASPYNAEADPLYVDTTTSARFINFTITMASVNPTPTFDTNVTVYFLTDRQGRKGDWYVDVAHALDGTNFTLQNNLTNQVTPLPGAVDLRSQAYVVHVPRSAIDSAYRGALLSRLGVMVSQQVGVASTNAGFIEQSTGPGYRYRVGYPYGCQK